VFCLKPSTRSRYSRNIAATTPTVGVDGRTRNLVKVVGFRWWQRRRSCPESVPPSVVHAGRFPRWRAPTSRSHVRVVAKTRHSR
jgi:hypothetical protein